LFKNQLNSNTILDNIKGFTKNKDFDYSINSFEDNGQSISFTIKITSTSSSKQEVISKEFKLLYIDLTPYLIREKERISGIKFRNQFSENQLINIKTNNQRILDYINYFELHKDWFNYEIFNFELTDTQFNLNIKVKFKTNDFRVEQTDKLSFNYTISNDVEDLEPGWSYKSDTKAEEVNQFSIEHLKKLHFNYPNYKGDLVTLKADGEPTHNYPGDPSNTPTGPFQFAKKGIIPTEKHLELSKRVFSVTFNNTTESIGTCWILDYKLTNDGSYPLTRYFGTNAHVLDDLKVENDTNYPEKFGKYDPNIFDQTSQIQGNYITQNTRWIDLWKLNHEKIEPNEQITSTMGSPDKFWTKTTVNMFDKSKDTDWVGIYKEGYYVENPPAKTIFLGNDFLTTSPKDSSTNSFSDKEEYADFGVFELTFENEQQARQATNNYAEWEKDKQFKYRESDLVNNPENQTSKIYELGFPQDGNNGSHASRTVSTNTNQVLYDQGKTDPNQGLSKSQHYNTWTHTYGGFDGHIAMPWFGYNYEWIDNNLSATSNFNKTTSYATYGLIYGVNNGNMAPGSSGGLTIDENGYAIGVHFGSDNNAATGQSQAFYCGGYDYKGYYGNYNLPQYDLIRGGYPKQKNSYYDSLVKIYGKDPNFKTNLFPNGLTSRR
ncbi:MAG: DUF31 family protein, partial [Mycoplasmataceae bacterium]|nr:DUF31 family protein [Mycoplasmataceae bacterium]